MINIALKDLIVAIFGAVTVVYWIYDFMSAFQDQQLSPDEDQDESEEAENKYGDDFVGLLKAINNKDIPKADLIAVLSNLANKCAITSFQDKIRELDYLPKISSFLIYADKEVQTQTALLINNLAMNIDNQLILKDCIPDLVELLETYEVDDSTVGLFTAILQALTNLTTLDSSHENLISRVPVLTAFLSRCTAMQLKIQVLKILVNISTNEKFCQNNLNLDAQLLLTVEEFIQPQVEEPIVLRAVTCCANVLQALHRRSLEKYDAEVNAYQIASDRLKENLLRLSLHPNEDVRMQVSRSLLSLYPINTGIKT